jgi:hypothetical protein
MKNEITQLAITFARQSGFDNLISKIQEPDNQPEKTGIFAILRPASKEEILNRLFSKTFDEQLSIFEKRPDKQYFITAIISDKRCSQKDRKKWALLFSLQLLQVIDVFDALNKSGNKEIIKLVQQYREVIGTY